MERIKKKGIKRAGITLAAFIMTGTVFGGGSVFAEEAENTILADSGQNAKNGWIFENGVCKYYKDGTAYTGWHYMGVPEGETTLHRSYFGRDGEIYTGWHYMGNNGDESAHHGLCFEANGRLHPEWKYIDQNNAGMTHWLYFGENGWLRTGWQYLDKKDGEKIPHWSYFGKNGYLRTGWLNIDKETTEADGNTDEHRSYLGADGWLRTGMQTMGTSANPDGNNDQHLSFFDDNGRLAKNKLFTYENKRYMADGNGWVIAIETEHEEVLARAMQLVSEITDESMSKEEKLWASYVHIMDEYPEYNPRIPHYADEGWHIIYADDIFVGEDGEKGGNCFSTAAAFAYMAKAIGYKDVYAISVNGHGWTEIDGLVYDAERERHHEGSYYALSYDTPIGTQDALEQYQWIFSAKSPYAKVKI